MAPRILEVSSHNSIWLHHHIIDLTVGMQLIPSLVIYIIKL